MAISGASGGVIGSAQTDITNPYETIPCKCIYCFVCLATKLEAEEGEGWVCLRCGETAKQCKPWAGDVLEEESQAADKKTVSFSDDEEDSSSVDEKHGLDDAAEALAHADPEPLWTKEGSDSGVDVAPG